MPRIVASRPASPRAPRPTPRVPRRVAALRSARTRKTGNTVCIIFRWPAGVTDRPADRSTVRPRVGRGCERSTDQFTRTADPAPNYRSRPDRRSTWRCGRKKNVQLSLTAVSSAAAAAAVASTAARADRGPFPGYARVCSPIHRRAAASVRLIP